MGFAERRAEGIWARLLVQGVDFRITWGAKPGASSIAAEGGREAWRKRTRFSGEPFVSSNELEDARERAGQWSGLNTGLAFLSLPLPFSFHVLASSRTDLCHSRGEKAFGYAAGRMF